ncbi:Zn(II)2Cys6 transcription factor [Penicillium manginii]|jgi:hypothetical protein|uniref:Zn(II)2Cys6 transcription factor n=1 Tax=Penicillium manginii TaxID=203109 RepID=UPI0025488F25|nr:Zn(II)2Cys6 transcription factor [Penicillium manginii]KAJ5732882.1 Zn(II)2Cys6 transcription factor [Penicillium manginii]
MSYPSAGSKDNGNTPDAFLTEHFEVQSPGKSLPEAPTYDRNDGALLHVASHDTENRKGNGHASRVGQCSLNNDLGLEMPTLISSYIPPLPMSCANSILLSRQDRLYLEYFPRSSLVKVLGKTYTWSNFRYICQNKASEEASVMYAVLALSASEMNQSLELPHAQYKGKFYYSLALECIADAVNNLTCKSNNMEAILGALFLVIAYARRFGSSLSNLQTHNQCLLNFLDIFRQPSEYGPDHSIDLSAYPSFTPFCAQMLLWIL